MDEPTITYATTETDTTTDPPERLTKRRRINGTACVSAAATDAVPVDSTQSPPPPPLMTLASQPALQHQLTTAAETFQRIIEAMETMERRIHTVQETVLDWQREHGRLFLPVNQRTMTQRDMMNLKQDLLDLPRELVPVVMERLGRAVSESSSHVLATTTTTAATVAETPVVPDWKTFEVNLEWVDHGILRDIHTMLKKNKVDARRECRQRRKLNEVATTTTLTMPAADDPTPSVHGAGRLVPCSDADDEWVLEWSTDKRDHLRADDAVAAAVASASASGGECGVGADDVAASATDVESV